MHYERETATNAVRTAGAFAVPNNATGVALQADTNDVRYTMDDDTDPTQTVGMILLNDSYAPEEFSVEDFRRIRFIRGAGTDGYLNAHFFAGRDV